MSYRLAMRRRLYAGISLAGALCAAHPAFAQAIEADDGGDEIVVTGSRIPQADIVTANPVLSLDSGTIQASGTINITDVLINYPALVGSSTASDNSGVRASIGNAGLNRLNLRNLGPDRTLVLVDGRRHVASLPGSSAVDINVLPTDLIESVEILTGGASAIYGADGVSGVVNFKLRQDFHGITARVQSGISEKGDAGQRLAAITIGHNFAGGRGNVALAYEYGKESRLEASDRSYLSGSDAINFVRNPADLIAGVDNPNVPDYVPLANIRYVNSARGGTIDVDFDGAPDFNGDGTPYEYGMPIPPFSLYGNMQGGDGTLVSDYEGDLLPEVRRHVVNALAHFDVSDALTLYAEGKYANVRTVSYRQPTYDYDLLIFGYNPYLPQNLQDMGVPAVLVNRDNFDLGRRGEDVERETYRAVLGARGAISPSVNYDLSFVYGRTDITNRYINNMYNDRFYAAIDVVDGPNGPTCVANLDPTWAPFQPMASRGATGATLSFTPGQCVPLNLFGEGQASQAALDFLRADTVDRSRIEQYVVSGAITGDLRTLFSLPGGELGFAIGGEYRKEKSRFTPDAIASQGLTFTNALSATQGQFDVKEVFAELSAPILSDVPLAHELRLGAAIRYSDYSTIGSTTTWKFDGAYAPVRDIKLRATYSQAVRAPNIGELFGGASESRVAINDPCAFFNVDSGSASRAANCAILLADAGVADPATFTGTSPTTQISGGFIGNPNLSEEKAKTWTAGLVVQPRFVPGLTLSADWYDIKLRNAVNTVTAQQLTELCVDQASVNNQFCDDVLRAPTTGLISTFRLQPQNVSRFKTAGLDLAVNYVLKPDWNYGGFNIRMTANYLDKLSLIGTPGAAPTDLRGIIYAPKYQANLDATWQMDGFALNYGLSWFDKTQRYSANEMAADPDIVEARYLYYKERWQHDIYASIDVDARFQLYGGVNNFTNAKPDIGQNRYPVSAVGRFFFVGAKVKLADIL
ncbi:TonB-dependent receptor plug domain-containing protein [Sphingobium boeckii]|uniref:Outer membrane receptor protein involved in Fe transport n=1 Tax=Sphingobium boeckii TaxID=1082345 RepID=A0A7W9EGY6_9SPHN|nr:TonB-dependent receptor [Sphingobium boeckii]MBB5687201.1 outer membrane receptor protein involved in Fe transport [Sphingobium boeckii]